VNGAHNMKPTLSCQRLNCIPASSAEKAAKSARLLLKIEHYDPNHDPAAAHQKFAIK
jgi:hypothetical protein